MSLDTGVINKIHRLFINVTIKTNTLYNIRVCLQAKCQDFNQILFLFNLFTALLFFSPLIIIIIMIVFIQLTTDTKD